MLSSSNTNAISTVLSVVDVVSVMYIMYVLVTCKRKNLNTHGRLLHTHAH